MLNWKNRRRYNMQYELINPSDPYTFLVENEETAALTVFLLSTMYGATPQDNSKMNIPVFMLGGSKEWYEENFHRTPDEGLEANRENVIRSLESMMYGGFDDREMYQAALDAIDNPEKKKNFIEKWQDRHGSMNDIGTYAHRLAEKMRNEMESN